MFCTRFALAVPAALLALCVNGADAGPLDPGLIPADASFILHCDVERFANSIIAQAAPDMTGSEFYEERTLWGQISREIDFALFRDVKSMTIFNAGEVQDDTVAVALITESIDQLFAVLPTILPSHRLSTMDGHQVHSWTEVVGDARRHWFAHVRPLDDALRMVIVGRNWEQVLDTIERAALPQADRLLPSVMLQRPGEGSMIYAALTSLDMFEPAAQWFSQIAQTVEGVSIDLREHETNLILEGTLRSTHEDEAAAVAQLLQGLVAMGRLAVARDPDPEMQVVRDALRQTRISTEQRLVRLSLAVPLDLVVEAMDEAGVAPHLSFRDRRLNVGVTLPNAEQGKPTDAKSEEDARDKPQ